MKDNATVALPLLRLYDFDSAKVKDFAFDIKESRQNYYGPKKEISRDDVELWTGVSSSSLRRIETGETSQPDLNIVITLVDFFLSNSQDGERMRKWQNPLSLLFVDPEMLRAYREAGFATANFLRYEFVPRSRVISADAANEMCQKVNDAYGRALKVGWGVNEAAAHLGIPVEDVLEILSDPQNETIMNIHVLASVIRLELESVGIDIDTEEGFQQFLNTRGPGPKREKVFGYEEDADVLRRILNGEQVEFAPSTLAAICEGLRRHTGKLSPTPKSIREEMAQGAPHKHRGQKESNGASR